MLWSGNDIGVWGYVLMAIGMVLFWGAISTGMVFLFRTGHPIRFRRGGTPTPDTAGNLLSCRSDREDIAESEYGSRIPVQADRRTP